MTRPTDRDQRACHAVILWAAFLIVTVVAVRTPVGHRLDAALNSAVHRPVGPPVDGWFGELARDVAPVLGAVVIAPLLLLAVFRRRWASIIAAISMAPVPLIAWLLRVDVIQRPEFGVPGPSGNTYPSTHTALLAAACSAIFFLWPRPPGRAVRRSLLATSFAGAFGNVVSHAHFPSDALGALLLASAQATTVAAVAQHFARSDTPPRVRRDVL